MKSSLLFLILLFSLTLHGQTNSDISLLKKKLSNESDPKKRSEIYSLLSWKSFIHGEKDHKVFSDDEMALYHFQKGGKFLLEYQNDNAKSMFKKAVDLIKPTQKHYLLPFIYMGLIWIDIEEDKLDQVLKKMELVETLKEKQIKDKSTIKKTTLYIWIFIILLLASLLIAFFLYVRNKDSKRYNDNLKAEVLKQTSLLKQSNNDLEQFATMISHDLKGPLSFLIMSYDYIKTHIKETKDKVIEDYFEAMISSSRQMIALIDDLLVYSKAHSRKMVLTYVDTEKLLDKIIGSIQTTTNKDDIEISHLALPIIVSDESHLYMIFKNLIENAIKYNKSKIRKVEIDYKKKLNHHQFSVTDNGIGIDKENKDKVFEMHKRLKATEGFEGMGIGLATCSIAVNRLGGSIMVVPKRTQGTTIQFTLPIRSMNSHG